MVVVVAVFAVETVVAFVHCHCCSEFASSGHRLRRRHVRYSSEDAVDESSVHLHSNFVLYNSRLDFHWILLLLFLLLILMVMLMLMTMNPNKSFEELQEINPPFLLLLSLSQF